MIEKLGKGNRVKKLIDSLMSEEIESSDDSVLIFDSLVHAAMKTERVRKLLADWTGEFIAVIEKELFQAYPKGKRHSEIAFGIVSIYFNYLSMMPLGMPQKIQKDARKAAHRFVENLKG